MYDNLIQYYIDYFMDERNNGFTLLCSSVCISLLESLYKKWTTNEGIPAIETLSLEQKNKFWELGKQFQEDKEKKILASKAAYALELMTGKN